MHKMAYFKLTLAILSWGGVYQAASYLILYMDPITVAFSRYLIASIVLLFILRRQRSTLIDIAQFKTNWVLLVSIGIIGIGLYNLVFFGAEKYIPANTVAIIFSVSPCLTAFLASLVFKQRVRTLGYTGMLIALLGTIGVISYSNPACGKFFCFDILTHLGRGEAYAVLLCIFAACYSIMNKQASILKIDSLTITACASVFGTILLFFCAITMGNFNGFWDKPFKFWLALAYVSILGSVISYLWYSEALKTLGVGKVVVFLNGVPFATVLIGILFLGNPISMPVILCGIVIVSGVLITNAAVKRSN